MLDKSIKHFWQTKSYGIQERDDPMLMTKQGQKATKILESTFNYNSNYYRSRLFWKGKNIILPCICSTVFLRFYILQKRLARNLTIAKKHKDIINDYI